MGSRIYYLLLGGGLLIAGRDYCSGPRSCRGGGVLGVSAFGLWSWSWLPTGGQERIREYNPCIVFPDSPKPQTLLTSIKIRSLEGFGPGLILIQRLVQVLGVRGFNSGVQKPGKKKKKNK